MSREERRQYQRTAGRRAANPYPTPPGRRQGRGTQPERARGAASRAQSSPADLRFTRRFWVRTLVGALVVGLLLLSLSWDPASRPGTDSLMYGIVAAVAYVIGMVGYRLVRRRMQQREPG